jgi:hypothetical protein
LATVYQTIWIQQYHALDGPTSIQVESMVQIGMSKGPSFGAHPHTVANFPVTEYLFVGFHEEV